MGTPIRRTDQRAEFAKAQTNKGMQEAMSQYQDWAKQNPSQAGPTAPKTFNMSSYSPSVPPQANGPAGASEAYPKFALTSPQASGGTNTAYTRAWNSVLPESDKKVAYSMGGPRNKTEWTERHRTESAKSYGGEGQGNLAYMPEDRRPAAFEARYTDLLGNQSSAPPTNQRDALIERINAAAQPYYANSGVDTKNMGQQQFDMPSLLRGAQSDAANGYVNPLLQGLYAR
jgi:hypothetical protein